MARHVAMGLAWCKGTAASRMEGREGDKAKVARYNDEWSAVAP